MVPRQTLPVAHCSQPAFAPSRPASWAGSGPMLRASHPRGEDEADFTDGWRNLGDRLVLPEHAVPRDP